MKSSLKVADDGRTSSNLFSQDSFSGGVLVMGRSYEYLLLKLGLKLNTSGDSVFELSQAKLSGHGSVDFLVGLEFVVVRNFKKDGVVVLLVVVLLVVVLLVVVLLVVVLHVVVLLVVVRSVELRKLCDTVKDGNLAGRHQFWEDSVVFLFTVTASSFTAAKVGAFVNHKNPEVLGVDFFLLGLFVLGYVLSGGFLFDEEVLLNSG